MLFSDAGRIGGLRSGVIRRDRSIKRKNDYYKKPIICKQVDYYNPLPFEEKNYRLFCSQRCAAIFNNKERVKLHYCHNCSYVIQEGSAKYCSYECVNTVKTKQRDIKIEKGLIPSRKILRKYLIRKFGYKFSICKLTRWMGKKIPLELDHIDGYSNNDLPYNLRMICNNCHAQTSTYGIKNRGKGRKSLKKLKEYMNYE